jgi:hypothetical protein
MKFEIWDFVEVSLSGGHLFNLIHKKEIEIYLKKKNMNPAEFF